MGMTWSARSRSDRATKGASLLLAVVSLGLTAPRDVEAATRYPRSCNAQNVCFKNNPYWRWAGECTWYAIGRRPDLRGIVRGNAGNWLNAARRRVATGNVPRAGAIAIWRPWTGYAWGQGHAAYVRRVSGDRRTVYVDEANWGTRRLVRWRRAVPANQISGYIY
jgi:surface antigen